MIFHCILGRYEIVFLVAVSPYFEDRTLDSSKRKKKKPHLGPKRKRMSRPERLASVKTKKWVGSYSGKRIVHAYRKWFSVDLLCAIAELRLLNVTISHEYEVQVSQSIAQRALEKKRRREARAIHLSDEFTSELDYGFGYVAGEYPWS
jgi:hypothetical protein